MNFPSNSMISADFLKTSESILKYVPEHTPEMRKAQLERLLRAYGPPLTSYLVKNRRLTADVAEEVLQSFLVEKLIEPAPEDNIASRFLKRKKEKTDVRFRDYLRRSLKHFLIDMSRAGKLSIVNLDDIEGQVEDARMDEKDELEYDFTWANSLLNQVCVAVRAECHLKKQPQVWDVLYERLLRPIETGETAASYEELCSRGQFESPKKAANLYMTGIRKFNRLLRDLVSDYLPAEGKPSPAAIQGELVELQKALATPGMLQLQQHPDFSINDSVNSLKQRLLCIPDDVASLWNEEDLANLWRTLLKGSISDLLMEISGKRPDVNASKEVNWSEQLSQLLFQETPCLNVLKKIKDLAKLHATQATQSLGIEMEIEDVFPPSVTMLMYGLSIALARVQLNERITRDRDEQFVPRACRLLEFSWIDKQSRQVLMDWLEILRK
jgi:hypothetical protein